MNGNWYYIIRILKYNLENTINTEKRTVQNIFTY